MELDSKSFEAHQSVCRTKALCVRAMAASDPLVQWDGFNVLSKRIPDNQQRRMSEEMESGPSNKTRDMHNGCTKRNQWSGSHSF